MTEPHCVSRREVLRWTAPLAAAVALPRAATAEPAGPTVEPDGVVHGRPLPQGGFPLIDCEGTAAECGEILGGAWKAAITLEAARAQGSKPWWKSPHYRPLLDKYAPHLPDLYRGMARGAGVSEDAVGERGLGEEPAGGCTSFALGPAATLEGVPISGQTKDVSVGRGRELCVVRMKIRGAPSMLTLTYPGSTWLFGHGFVQGGTAIFRNSLYVAKSAGRLPYSVWGLVALHCPKVDDVMEITNRYGAAEAFHVVVADCRGGIVGIEGGKGGYAFLRPEKDIYTHANAVMSDGELRQTERDGELFRREESLHRTARLAERLKADRGRLTAQLAYNALCDHERYPTSICRHQSTAAHTAAVVIAEPTRGLLHVTRGPGCQSFPRTYSLT